MYLFSKEVIKEVNFFVIFFQFIIIIKKPYLYLIGSALKKEAQNYQVNGGGLKRWVNTRWHTMFDCVDSIKRHKEVLEKVILKLLFVFNFYY